MITTFPTKASNGHYRLHVGKQLHKQPLFSSRHGGQRPIPAPLAPIFSAVLYPLKNQQSIRKRLTAAGFKQNTRPAVMDQFSMPADIARHQRFGIAKFKVVQDDVVRTFLAAPYKLPGKGWPGCHWTAGAHWDGQGRCLISLPMGSAPLSCTTGRYHKGVCQSRQSASL